MEVKQEGKKNLQIEKVAEGWRNLKETDLESKGGTFVSLKSSR